MKIRSESKTVYLLRIRHNGEEIYVSRLEGDIGPRGGQAAPTFKLLHAHTKLDKATKFATSIQAAAAGLSNVVQDYLKRYHTAILDILAVRMDTTWDAEIIRQDSKSPLVLLADQGVESG